VAGKWTSTPISDVTEEEVDRLIVLNTKAVSFGPQQAAHRPYDGGRVINTTSGATVSAPATQSVHVAAKAGVAGLTRVAAKELAARGTTVNAVSLGATDTDQLRATTTDEVREQMTAQSVFGRLGTPEDIADVIALLASSQARWLTGAIVHTSGGLA